MNIMDALDTRFISCVENAVQESLRDNKALIVYTTNGDNSWFESWFTPLVSEQLNTTCVWLRLMEDTREMGYFKQIFPDVRVPSVYCIAKGQIVEMIGPDQVNMDGFATRLIRAVGKSKRVLSGDLESVSSQVPGDSRAADIDRLLEYQMRARKHQLSEQQERERIVRLMKADREEMKQRRLSSSAAVDEYHMDVSSMPIHDNIKNRDVINSAVCTLLIRLTNGKTMRHDFDSQKTLNDVRSWLDNNRTDKDVPYQFHRNIPRETFTESQELISLKHLELTPRSALILKPIEDDTFSGKIADVEGPGLLGKMYQHVASWWSTGSTVREQPKEHKTLNDGLISSGSSNYASPLSSPKMVHSDALLPPRAVSPSTLHYAQANDDSNN